MNKIGISSYFGKKSIELDIETRAKAIKDAGFDTFIASTDPRFFYQNGDPSEQIKIFKKNGMKPSSLHNHFKHNDLPFWWTDSEIGDNLENTLINSLYIAKENGYKCVVMHFKGIEDKDEIQRQIGIERLNRVLKVCEELNIPLAAENSSSVETFKFVFDNIDNKYLRFCYDSGHNHCFSPEFDYLENYFDKLICLHLHDNYGDEDDHSLIGDGNIDWDNIAQKLAHAPEDINLDLEIECKNEKLYENISVYELLKRAATGAKLLQKTINNYRNQYDNDGKNYPQGNLLG